jgi:hypothetical protein
MDLMPGEKILIGSDATSLVLTTHRVRYHTKSWSDTRLTSIMLEELCSCTMANTSKPLFLVLAVLFLLGGFFIRNNYGYQFGGDPLPIGVAVAVVL